VKLIASSCRLCICITSPDGSSQVVPFMIKEVVVLASLDVSVMNETYVASLEEISENEAVQAGTGAKNQIHGGDFASRVIASGTFFFFRCNRIVDEIFFPQVGWILNLRSRGASRDFCN
jgi:hypothetical protein